MRWKVFRETVIAASAPALMLAA
ncbi:MAG: hypothetical protein QOJ42_2270, partial [Acidobacteriaceae bacterium]|nr:hypothetical protein [Acidobacteriaceae bacterium]